MLVSSHTMAIRSPKNTLFAVLKIPKTTIGIPLNIGFAPRFFVHSSFGLRYESAKGVERTGTALKMVATNLKAATLSLMDNRASMEAEMNAIIAQLSSPGGPGISGNLVDAEGFPRSDVDIPSIRAQRARLLVLRNDHKAVTAKIDENLQVLHSVKLGTNGPHPQSRSDTSNFVYGRTSQATPMVVDPISRIPFAMVDEISDASPAAEDGLQLGDQIIKFGNVEIGDALIARLASEAQLNEGHSVPVLIMRQGTQLNLTITPRHWHGRGLLGCHFRIL